jgi:hypothetical protein
MQDKDDLIFILLMCAPAWIAIILRLATGV